MGYGYGYYGGDIGYWLIVIVSLVLGALTQGYIKRMYAKWSKVPARIQGTGAEVARRMLDEEGASAVGITHVAGTLTDFYDPRDNKLHLSPANYGQASVASVAVACHEAGHAVQTAQGYGPIKIRTALVPAVNFASQSWMILFFLGVFMNLAGLMRLAVWIFAITVIFQLVTLPVEIDASRRAVAYLGANGQGLDQKGAKQVLTAAALTYVAAALVSILQLLYYANATRNRD